MRPMIIALGILLVAMLIAYIIMRSNGSIGFIGNKVAPTPTPVITGMVTPVPSSSEGLVDTLNRNSSLGLFYKAINDTGLNGVLDSGDPYTVFALDNNSMQNILNNTGNNINLLNDKLKLQISYGILDNNQIQSTITALNGQSVSLGNAKVNNTIPVNNGIIYVLSAPVNPQ